MLSLCGAREHRQCEQLLTNRIVQFSGKPLSFT